MHRCCSFVRCLVPLFFFLCITILYFTDYYPYWCCFEWQPRPLATTMVQLAAICPHTRLSGLVHLDFRATWLCHLYHQPNSPDTSETQSFPTPDDRRASAAAGVLRDLLLSLGNAGNVGILCAGFGISNHL